MQTDLKSRNTQKLIYLFKNLMVKNTRNKYNLDAHFFDIRI